MKDKIIKIAKDLENGNITEDRAINLLLGLFSVSKRLLEGCRVKHTKYGEIGTIEIVGYDYYVVRWDVDKKTDTVTEEWLNVC